MLGPRAQLFITGITLLLLDCFLPVVHPGAISSYCNWCTHIKPSTWYKRNVVHQTRPPSFIVPWFSNNAYVPTEGTVDDGQQSTWTLWPVCGPILSKLRCTVCSDTCQSWQALNACCFLAICATVAYLWHWTSEATLHFHHASISFWHPSLCCWFTGCPFLDHLIKGTELCWEHLTRFGLEMLWPSHLAITILSLSKLLRSSCLHIFPTADISNSRQPNKLYPTDIFYPLKGTIVTK